MYNVAPKLGVRLDATSREMQARDTLGLAQSNNKQGSQHCEISGLLCRRVAHRVSLPPRPSSFHFLILSRGHYHISLRHVLQSSSSSQGAAFARQGPGSRCPVQAICHNRRCLCVFTQWCSSGEEALSLLFVAPPYRWWPLATRLAMWQSVERKSNMCDLLITNTFSSCHYSPTTSLFRSL